MSEPGDGDNGVDSFEATRSGRHIKRRRFDDEIVESSLGTSGKLVNNLLTTPPQTSSISIKSAEEPQTQVGTKALPPPVCTQNTEVIKEFEESDGIVEEWTPSDDFTLVNSVLQTCSLDLVALCASFSFPFTVQDISARWRTLLNTAQTCPPPMKLHPTTLDYLRLRIPFSAEEEGVLAKIAPSDAMKLPFFEQVLEQEKATFLPCRTPKALQKHWQLMKQKFLLDDQHVPPTSEKELLMSLSDLDDIIHATSTETRKSIQTARRQDFDLSYELRQLHRSARKEIKCLERTLPLWQMFAGSISNHHSVDFDDQTIAVLRGRLVRYLMRSKEISLGRSSREVIVDIDFALEGPAYKISRRQAIIKLRNNGEFVFANEGKRTVYIDGNPVLTGNKCRLIHNSVLELATLRFVFLVNHKISNAVLDQAS